MTSLPGSWDWCSAPSAGLPLGQGPGPVLLPHLGLKRSWYLGAEHQLGPWEAADRCRTETPPETAAKSHSQALPGAAESTHPCSAPEKEENQPEQELRQHKAPCYQTSSRSDAAILS